MKALRFISFVVLAFLLASCSGSIGRHDGGAENELSFAADDVKTIMSCSYLTASLYSSSAGGAVDGPSYLSCNTADDPCFRPMVFITSKGNRVIFQDPQIQELGDGYCFVRVSDVVGIRREPRVVYEDTGRKDEHGNPIMEQKTAYVEVSTGYGSNFAIIGTTLAFSLGGAAGGAVSASMQAPAIIYYNVVAVLCLTIYSDKPDRAVDVAGILKTIAVNPMILGQVAGLLCLAAREFIPRDAQGALVFSLSRDLAFLYSAVESLADLASPMILILLGARVNFSAVKDMKKELAVGVVQRLVLAPAVGLGMAFLAQALGLFAVTPAVLSALVGMYGSPVASASAVMAEEMGGDAELARQYIVWTSAFSMGTLFLWIFLLRTVHLL